MFTIALPSPISRAAACVAHSADLRLIANTRSKSSSVRSSSSAACVTPALLTRMSSPPQCPVTCAKIRSISLLRLTSAVTACWPRSAAARAAPSASISASRTCAPSATNAAAIARPIPCAAPVTTARLPCSRPAMSVAPVRVARALVRLGQRPFGHTAHHRIASGVGVHAIGTEFGRKLARRAGQRGMIVGIDQPL